MPDAKDTPDDPFAELEGHDPAAEEELSQDAPAREKSQDDKKAGGGK